MRVRLAAFALACLIGCGSTAENNDAPGLVTNKCRSDADCGPSGRCVQKQCDALQGSFDSLLIEISVPGTLNAQRFAGMTFLSMAEGLPLAGGQRDLAVPEVTQVNGRILVPDSCGVDFTKAPLGITFTPRVSWIGLVVHPITVQAKCAEPGCSPEFSAALPPGDYELYVQPDASTPSGSAGSCNLVPQAHYITLEASTRLDLKLSQPASLSLDVIWPVQDGLDGWSMDVLDPGSGRRLSEIVELGGGAWDATAQLHRYSTQIAYAESPDTSAAGGELVRLSPPKDVTAPTFLYQRLAVQLLNGTSTLDPMSEIPETVTIDGTLMDGQPDGLGRPISGAVQLIAEEQGLDDIEPGRIASLIRTVQADVDGSFQVALLPGKYKVRALPPDRCPTFIACPGGAQTCDCPLGASEVEWVVGKTPAYQAGKTVVLTRRTEVTGSADNPLGTPASGASVSIVSMPAQSTVLTSVFGEAAPSARASVGSVDSSGQFSVLADEGRFQFAIRPAVDTGFPWLVHSELVVNGELAGQTQDLGSLALPLPVRYSGRVLVGTTVLPDVLLRAYAVLASSSGAKSVVQVAEATADAAGNFQILVPSYLEVGLSSGN